MLHVNLHGVYSGSLLTFFFNFSLLFSSRNDIILFKLYASVDYQISKTQTGKSVVPEDDSCDEVGQDRAPLWCVSSATDVTRSTML